MFMDPVGVQCSILDRILILDVQSFYFYGSGSPHERVCPSVTHSFSMLSQILPCLL